MQSKSMSRAIQLKSKILILLAVLVGASFVFAQPMPPRRNTFLILGDTPSTFSGQGSKVLRVNADATAIEFYHTDFNSVGVDSITWSDGLNASNIWTFDVSGTDHTMTASSGLMTFSNNVTAAGLTITNAAVLGSDSVVFQPNTDTGSFLQVLDADGGDPILDVNTIDERVGIGTANPGTDVEIRRSASDPKLTIRSTNDSFDPALELSGNAGMATEGVRLRYDNSVGDFYIDTTFNDDASSMHFRTKGSTERMTILGNGRVGIGTTDPCSTLTVEGTDFPVVQIARTERTSDIMWATISAKVVKTTSMGDGFGPNLVFFIEDDTAEEAIAAIGAIRNGADDTGKIAIGTFNAGSFSQRVWINHLGYMGIGQAASTPLSFLEIMPDGNVRGLDIDGTANMTTAQAFRIIMNAPTSANDGRCFTIDDGSAFSRCVFYSNTFYGMGPGTGTRDVFLGRSGTNTIRVGSVFDGTGNATFSVNEKIGINELSPETTFEATTTAPYLTLHNSTHEDGDGGRESRLNFKGEQSGGEETTLARIEVSHDGAADDEKGKVVISVNDGDDSDAPTQALEIGSDLLATFAGSVTAAGLTSTGVVDLGGSTTVEIANAESSDATLGALGQIHIRGDEDRISYHVGAGGEVAGEVTTSVLKIVSASFDPGSWYDSDAELFLFEVHADVFPNGIIIDEWKVSCNADPDVEMNANIGYADSWFDAADPNLVDVIDTTNGVSSEDTDSNINSGNAIAAGKCLFLYFDADPEGTAVQMNFTLIFHAEED